MDGEKPGIESLLDPGVHRAEIVYGALAFGAALLLATQLGSQLVWKSGQPIFRQPGFFSAISILGMLFFGALELRNCWRRNASAKGGSIASEVGFWVRSVEFALWFMAYVYAVPVVGYLPTTLVFCLMLTFRLGYRSGKMFIAALLVGLATVVIFKSFLQVKIPGGAVYEYLPATLRNFMIIYL